MLKSAYAISRFYNDTSAAAAAVAVADVAVPVLLDDKNRQHTTFRVDTPSTNIYSKHFNISIS